MAAPVALSSLRPAEAVGAPEDLLPHNLFNRINNGQPLIILDLRDVVTFEACHLKSSHHVPLPSFLPDTLATLISPTTRGIRYFVLLLPTEVSSATKEKWIKTFEDAVADLRGQTTSSQEEEEEEELPAVPSDLTQTAVIEPQPPAEEPSFLAKLYLLPNCEQFFTAYASCAMLFEYGRRSTSLTKYYASEILPGCLFLGDCMNAADQEQLQALGITHVIDVTNEHRSEQHAAALGIAYLAIDVWDTEDTDIAQHFPATNDFINAAVQSDKNKVLVHCRAGWSRSASVVIAFVMQHLRMDLISAAKLVVKERPVICPNAGFREQLMEYEKQMVVGALLSATDGWVPCNSEKVLQKTIVDDKLSDSTRHLDVLSAHELFNRINNSQPTIVLDLRDATAFGTCRLRNAHHLADTTCLFSTLAPLVQATGKNDHVRCRPFAHWARRNVKYFVALLPSDTTEEARQEWIDAFEKTIVELKGQIGDGGQGPGGEYQAQLFLLPNCEQFFEAYANCTMLFEFGRKRNVPAVNKQYSSEIIPGFLFLGDYRNGTDTAQLQELGITHIIDLTSLHRSEPNAKELGLAYLPIDIQDEEQVDILQHLPATNAFINAAFQANAGATKPTRVLAHCRAGWSRSATVVIAFVMQHLLMDLISAAKLVVKERPMICPNTGFRTQLVAYEQELMSSLSPEDWVACPDEKAMREALLEASCLWTQELTYETTFDTIPIDANKDKAILEEMLKAKEDPEVQAMAAAKPKKAFLKRGQGKSMQTMVKNKSSAVPIGDAEVKEQAQSEGDAANVDTDTGVEDVPQGAAE